jgi:hypothetical protein
MATPPAGSTAKLIKAAEAQPVKPAKTARSVMPSPPKPAVNTPADTSAIDSAKQYQVWLNYQIMVGRKPVSSKNVRLRGDALKAQLAHNAAAIAAWTEIAS